MEKIIIFGSGTAGKRTFNALKKKSNILLFADNSPKMHHKQFFGLNVIPPEELHKQKFDTIVIASQYYPQIYKQLIDLGIPEGKIEVISLNVMHGQNDLSLSFLFSLISLIILPLILILYYIS